MKNNKHIITSLIVFAIFLLTACGQKEEQPPPHYGVFLRKGSDIVELIPKEVFGSPTERQIGEVPSANDSQPVITFWNPDLVLQYLQFFSITNGDELSYDVTPKDDGVVDVRPSDPLDSGLYCFIQGNPAASFLNAWCFRIGESGDVSQESSASESTSNDVAPTMAPQLSQSDIAEAQKDALEGENVATVSAAENLLKTATSISATQLAPALEATDAAYASTEEYCRAVVRKIKDGDYSDIVPGANFANCTFTLTDFFGMEMTNVDFSNSWLRSTNFSGANLSGVNFTGAELDENDFTGSNLSGAIFSNAYLTDPIFTDAILNGDELADSIREYSRKYALSWSPDGDSIILNSYTKMDLQTGIEENIFEGMDIIVIRSFAFSPDGKFIAIQGQFDENIDKVRIWDLSNNSLKSELLNPENRASSISWMPSSDYILISMENALYMGDIETGEWVREHKFDYPVIDLSYSTDGIYYARVINPDSDKLTIEVYNSETNELVNEFEFNEYIDVFNYFNFIGWDPTSSYLVAIFHDGYVIFNPFTGDVVDQQDLDGILFDYLEWSADGKFILTVYANGIALHDFENSILHKPSEEYTGMWELEQVKLSPTTENLVLNFDKKLIIVNTDKVFPGVISR